MERHTELKRGEGPKRNPAKVREWKDRTAKRLPRASKQRRKDERERAAFRDFVIKHRPRCEAALPWCCTHASSEVNELQRGSGREDCWLDWDKVTSLCSACHRFITLNPQWAKAHGHQVEVGHVEEAKLFRVAETLRHHQAQGLLRHWPTLRECEIDHRTSVPA